MKLTYKQTVALRYLEDCTTEELLFGGGAGGGKSVLGSFWILKMALKYKGTRWLIGRAKLKSLYDTTVRTFFEVAKMQGLRANIDYKLNRQSGLIQLFNGSEIFLRDLFYYPSDPEFDNLGSLEITGAFVDEANQITEKAKDILGSRIRYKLDENNLIPKTLYTCNPSKNWTYREFYQPDKNGTIKDYRKFLASLVTDNPKISKHYIRNLNKLKPKEKERLLYGNWEYDDDIAKLFEYQDILYCFDDYTLNEDTKDYYISCDVARKGSDYTVIMLSNGLDVVLIDTMETSKVNEVVNRVNLIRDRYDVPLFKIVVDDDGVGGGVVDYLGCKGFVNGSSAKNGENYANLKSQCYFVLSDKIANREVTICETEHTQRIIEELGVVKQKDIDKDGKRRIIPKDKMKEILGYSPDFSDTLMMRMYFEYSISYASVTVRR